MNKYCKSDLKGGSGQPKDAAAETNTAAVEEMIKQDFRFTI